MMDERNEFGFPVMSRLEAAKQYAAEAKERNKQPCDCEPCRIREAEAAVIRLTQNWRAK